MAGTDSAVEKQEGRKSESVKEMEAAQESLLSSLLPLCRLVATTIPGKDDLVYRRSVSEQYSKSLDDISETVMDQLRLSLERSYEVLHAFDQSKGGQPSGQTLKERRTERTDARNATAAMSRSEEKLRRKLKKLKKLTATEHLIEPHAFRKTVIEPTESMLEMADTILDDLTRSKLSAQRSARGVVERSPLAIPEHVKTSFRPTINTGLSKIQAHATPAQRLTIDKPQTKFTYTLDNMTSQPWMPRIKEKGIHALPGSSLDLSLHQPVEPEDPHKPWNASQRALRVANPFTAENDHFVQNPPSSLLKISQPIKPLPLESTPLTFIDTVDQLQELVQTLSTQSEIAIDLEHHDHRSYSGITCLMQCSTRQADYIIDTIALRDDLQCLNVVFTNPAIVKVLHGASMDIIWLQRDLGLYIVGLFDTYHASHALSLPQHSLAGLLSLYCDFQADKSLQLADWRQRPLTQALIDYARSDTHFLLYIYDRMRNSILESSDSSLMSSTIQSSATTAQRVYVREIYDEEGIGSGSWRTVLDKHRRTSTNIEQSAFSVLYKWRDELARRNDESPRYVAAIAGLLAVMDSDMSSPNAAELIGRRLGVGHRGVTADDVQKLVESLQQIANQPTTTQVKAPQLPPSNNSHTIWDHTGLAATSYTLTSALFGSLVSRATSPTEPLSSSERISQSDAPISYDFRAMPAAPDESSSAEVPMSQIEETKALLDVKTEDKPDTIVQVKKRSGNKRRKHQEVLDTGLTQAEDDPKLGKKRSLGIAEPFDFSQETSFLEPPSQKMRKKDRRK